MKLMEYIIRNWQLMGLTKGGDYLGYCSHCKMFIRDNTIVCPLCRTVLEYDKALFENKEAMEEGVYPQVVGSRLKWDTLLRFFLLFSVLCEGILVTINTITFKGYWWSFICGGAIIFSYISFKRWTRNYSGHVQNILIEFLGACFLSVLVDYVLGYRGWSVNYAIPCALMLSEIAAVILMILFINSWHRYVSLLLFDLVFSFLMVIMVSVGIVTWPVLTFIAAGVSIIIFALTLIMGGRKAENELKRRFRI